jgi:soluble lytic murein transglycosylase-like protein
MRFLIVYLCLAGGCLAGETAVLANGARMRVDRHELDGTRLRLYNGPGFIEMESAMVQRFEVDEAAEAPAGEKAPAAAVPEIPAVTGIPQTPMELADAAADKYGVPRWLVRSVMATESSFQPGAVSPKGAIGLMQLMPATAQSLGVDPRDPVQNVDGGTRYLRDLLLLYGGRLWHAAAAYNAGPGAVDKYNGVPPYRETLRYVDKINKAYRKSTATASDGTP